MCYILKIFFKFFKTIKESISCNIGEFFHSKNTQWEIRHSKALHWLSKGSLISLQEHSKEIWALAHSRALEEHLGTRAQKAVGHLGVWALEDRSHSSTQSTLGYSCVERSWALRGSGTWALGYSRHLI